MNLNDWLSDEAVERLLKVPEPETRPPAAADFPFELNEPTKQQGKQ